jgi:hypothetical protein
MVTIVGQPLDGERDAVVLTRSTIPLFAAIAREGMHRPSTNASVVVRNVGEKIRAGLAVER